MNKDRRIIDTNRGNEITIDFVWPEKPLSGSMAVFTKAAEHIGLMKGIEKTGPT